MMKNEVTCDHCKRNLTRSGNSVDYRIVVKSEPIPSAPGPVTDMMIYPPIPEDLHFCGLRCMREWVAAKRM